MLKFDLALFNSYVTLKIGARSPKCDQVFIMPHLYIHENLVPIHHLVHEISCTQEIFLPMSMEPSSITICPSKGDKISMRKLHNSRTIYAIFSHHHHHYHHHHHHHHQQQQLQYQNQSYLEDGGHDNNITRQQSEGQPYPPPQISHYFSV